MKAANFTVAVALAATAVLTACSNDPDYAMDKFVDNLYDNMPMGERVAQLRSMYMDVLFDEDNRLIPSKCEELIPDGIGHFSQYAFQQPLDQNVLRDKVAQLQDWLMNNTPNGIPALFHEEVLSGVNALNSTIYPQQIGQACSFNTELAELKTLQTGIAMRKIGGVLALSPMVDVCRTPDFNRLEESYGEDGYLSAAFGTAFVRGLQQGDLRKGVGTTSKHYLGYGGGGDAEEKELMEEILLPHETMIRLAGSKSVMTGYHTFHGTKCVANSEIINDILRNYLGFDGMMVSDYGAINQIPDLDSPMEKAAASINAGNDADFPGGDNFKYLPEAIEKGLVSPETLERAVKDVLRYKYRAGLFDDEPYLYSKEDIVFDSDAERQTAYDIASQSIVLLENDGILPLKDNQKVFVTGPNANSMWAMCGDYSFPAMSYFWHKIDVGSENPHIVKLLDAMQAGKPEGISISYSRGCDWTEEVENRYTSGGDARADRSIQERRVDSGEKADKREALRLAAGSDVIVAAMGENVLLCGESRTRPGLRLPGRQEQYVEELLATGKPVILVVFGGRAQVISAIADRCAAVIQAWYPGEEGGTAVADILYGRISPSGKLSVSYPNVELSEPICYNYSAEKDPRIEWPFGYGLSYTTFEYSDISAPAEAKVSDESVELSFTVKNTGAVAADEVAQIYLSPTSADQNIRPRQLQGFARVSLKPGESKTVRVRLYTDQFGYYSHENERCWNIDPGRFLLKVGSSSEDIRLQTELSLTGDSVRKSLRDNYFSEIF